jgi:hypothetical protein
MNARPPTRRNTAHAYCAGLQTRNLNLILMISSGCPSSSQCSLTTVTACVQKSDGDNLNEKSDVCLLCVAQCLGLRRLRKWLRIPALLRSPKGTRWDSNGCRRRSLAGRGDDSGQRWRSGRRIARRRGRRSGRAFDGHEPEVAALLCGRLPTAICVLQQRTPVPPSWRRRLKATLHPVVTKN